MTEPAQIEIREPGRPIRRVLLDRAIEVGRDCDGENVADQGVSRRHLKIAPSPLAVSVVDLGSRNGTLVNGVPIEGRHALEHGDVIRLGSTEIVLVRPPVQAPVPAPRGTVLLTREAFVVPPPPPAPVVAAPPGVLVGAVRRVLYGRPLEPGQITFADFTELPTRVPAVVWHAVRAVSIAAYLALCVCLFVWPAGALFTFFKVIVPLLPILFFLAPGLWRNICPLAASNQLPRVLGFTRGLTAPDWLRNRGYLVAITLFFGIASARLVLFNSNGAATGVLLSVVILNAFAAGLFFKGKSGWCSSICPLLPLQRVYGQTPFITVPNSHCQPCVGCTKNCYDFRPQAAYQADLHDSDPGWNGPRKLFASALPGFVLGFFTLINGSDHSVGHVYARLGIYLLGSVGSFFALEALLPLTSAMLTALYASVALNLFYWYGAVVVVSSIHTITGASLPWVKWPIRVVVLGFTIIWLFRTRITEQRYLVKSGAGPQLIQTDPVVAARSEPAAAAAEVRFLPEDKPTGVEVGMSLLEVAEREGLSIEAGCRMGVCGADPVAVVDGAGCLSAPEEEELNTLRRLGLAPNTRMACCARVESGSVKVGLTPEPGPPGGGEGPAQFDRSILSVVVLGNGIAGVTAADFVRRGHPDCEIHIVGRESHVLYNRMGISRLVYGRSAMQGLFLLNDQWYDEHGVTAWLNTLATSIDTQAKQVLLGTGEVLYYDRLILAAGSSSVIPPVEGFGAPGSFVLREASDAIDIRGYAQSQGSRNAVVAGGGLLGLEAAYSLHQLGLKVTVLERGTRLMSRQIDPRCSDLVQAHFDRLGITVLYGAESAGLSGAGRIDTLTLRDGRTLPCDVFLAAVGIKPNSELAERAGIAVNRGVLVNDRMETSVPGVYAAGDVAEHNGMVFGLWPTAAKQGEVAAVNALGGDETVSTENPATILKGVGLELTSIGRVNAPDDEVIVVDDPLVPSYRRLVISDDVVVGAVVLGHHPEDLAAATAAVKRQQRVDDVARAALRRGDWRALKAPAAVP